MTLERVGKSRSSMQRGSVLERRDLEERDLSISAGVDSEVHEAHTREVYGSDVSSLEMSLIIPAYNEAGRLPSFLETVRPYMDETFGQSYEVIVVDDGSSDGTAEKVAELSWTWSQLKIEKHSCNQGKGSAVRTGVGLSRGGFVMFADADGACALAEESKLRKALLAGADVAIGSRRVGTSLERSRVWHRSLIGWSFSFLTRLSTGLSARDTQCGFKMFRGDVARELLALCPRDDYLFDICVLILAQMRGYRMMEIGVNWQEVAGSHLHLISDSAKMIVGLVGVRRQARQVLRKRRLA